MQDRKQKIELVGGLTRRGKYCQLDARDDNLKTAVSCGLHFGMSFEKQSHTQTQTCEDGPHEEERVKTTIENVHDNLKSLSLLSFSSHFVSFCKHGQISFHSLFISSRRLLKGGIANKFSISKPKTGFLCIRQFFSRGGYHDARLTLNK